MTTTTLITFIKPESDDNFSLYIEYSGSETVLYQMVANAALSLKPGADGPMIEAETISELQDVYSAIHSEYHARIVGKRTKKPLKPFPVDPWIWSITPLPASHQIESPSRFEFSIRTPLRALGGNGSAKIWLEFTNNEGLAFRGWPHKFSRWMEKQADHCPG